MEKHQRAKRDVEGGMQIIFSWYTVLPVYRD